MVFSTAYGIFPHSSARGCRQSVCASMPVMATVRSCPWGGKREPLTRCEVIPDKSTMAGVFDIDLDQPEENVSDDELEEVTAGRFWSKRHAGVSSTPSRVCRPEARGIRVRLLYVMLTG